MSCNRFFLFNETATTEIYTYVHTLSLHDALPIYPAGGRQSLSSEIGTALNAVAQNCFRGRGAVIRRRGALAMTLGALVAVTGFMDQGIIATRAAVELPVRSLNITLSKIAREEFVSQLKQFADEHAFVFRVSQSTPAPDDTLVH